MSDTGPAKNDLDRLKSAVNELTILNDLALAASNSPEIDRVLDIIVEKARHAVNADQGSIMLVTSAPESPLQTLIRQADQSQIMSGYKVGISISGWVLKYRQPLLIEDLASDDRFRVSQAEAEKIRTVLCVPIMFKSELLGVMIMANKRSGGSFGKDDLRLLTIMSAQSGQLIRNSQMQVEIIGKKQLEHELHLAREIQKKLLPEELPVYPGLEVAVFFRPHISVSGDYYDFFALGKNRLGVIAADVSGHGPSAALVMSLLKGVAHSVIAEHDQPAQIVSRINRICSEIIPPDMFITLLYCVVETDRKKITLANAGHNPPVFFGCRQNRIHMEEATGCALNLLPDVKYQESSLDAESGDIILIYTDGLPEAINSKDEPFGLERMTRLISSHKDRNASGISVEIGNALTAHEGDGQTRDDVLMIVLKFRS